MIGLCGIVVLLTACNRPPDEASLRNTLAAMVKAVEKKDSSGFLEHVAEDFHDHDGRDRNALRRLLAGHFLQHQNIGLWISDTTVSLRNGTAEVHLRAQMTSGTQPLADRRFGAYRVRTGWRLHGSHWRLIEAAWEPA